MRRNKKLHTELRRNSRFICLYPQDEWQKVINLDRVESIDICAEDNNWSIAFNYDETRNHIIKFETESEYSSMINQLEEII